jgi:hypothetical protein
VAVLTLLVTQRLQSIFILIDAHLDASDNQANGALVDDALIDSNIAELHYGKLKPCAMWL